MIHFGDYCRQTRAAKEIPLREFCRKANVDPANWSKIERGIASPPKSMEILNRVARALELESVDAHDMVDLATVDSIPDDLRPSDDILEDFMALLRLNRKQ